jgi:hypothetical protein
MRRFLSILSFVFIVLTLHAAGQAVSARLEGVVQDPTKAVIQAAKVTALQQETGYTQVVVTNNEGLYVFPNLVPGHYTVRVEAQGLTPATIKNIVLEIGDSRRADATLVPQGSTTTVEVQASGTTINTSTTEVGAVVSSEQAVDLPLANRDAMMLFYLQAGTNPLDQQSSVTVNGGTGPGAQQQVGVVNGLPPGTSEIKVEGILASNPGYDYSPAHPSLPVPQEAVGEYRVNTAGYASSEGHGSAAQVKVLVKSGTNSFHGSVFEFNRNTDYDSNDFFDTRQGAARPVLKRNQFGGAFGGPILKNKTFIFGTAEWQRQIAQSIENRTVYYPNVSQNGIFTYTDTVTDTQKTINLTTIDPTRTGFDTTFLPVVLKALSSSPFGNATIPNNNIIGDGVNTGGFLYHSSNPDDYYEFLFKVDHDITGKNRLAGTYSQYFETAPQAKLLTGQSSEGLQERRRGLAVRWTSEISPTLVNEFSIGGDRRFALRPELISAELGPNNNYQLAGLGTGSVYGGTTNGNIYSSVSSQKNPAVIIGFADAATKSWKQHTFEFGGELWHETLNRYLGSDQWPVISTSNSGIATNIPNSLNLTSSERSLAGQLVNDITGTVGSIVQDFYITQNGYVPYQQLEEDLNKHEYGLFASDIYKVRSNLTIDLGIRWDLFPPTTILNGYVYPTGGINGALGVYGPAGAPTTFQFAPNKGGSIYNTDKHNFGPSIGIVYDPFKKGTTSLRASYGVAYDRAMIVANDFSSTNYGASTSITLNPTTTAGPDLKFGQVSTVLPFTTPTAFATSTANIRTGTVYVAQPNLSTPYVQSWTVGVQQEFFKNWGVSATYVGNHVVGEWAGNDINQVNLTSNGFLSAFQIAQQNYVTSGKKSITGPTPVSSNSALNALFAELPASQFATLGQGQAATIANYFDATAPSGGVKGGYVSKAGLAPNFFRYNPQFASVYQVGNRGQSNYHGLQLEVQHKLSHGATLQANYVFSKGFANYAQDAQTFTTTLLDINNPSLNKALNPYDATHVVVANGLYVLPFGKGQYIGANANKVVNSIIGGWRVSGIYGFTTGRPLAITTGYGTLNQDVNSTPNFTGNYGHLTSVNKTGTPTFLSAANAALFTNPVAGQSGNVPLYSLRAPNYSNFDAGLTKNTDLGRFREGVNLEFRVEFYNALNHTNFAAPSGNSLNINNVNFGTLTSTLAPRIGQLAAKLTF